MTCGECANVTAPGKGFPNHVYCLRLLLHMEKREDASRCRNFIPKPQTNADRIRAMTDEELAELIGRTSPNMYPCPPGKKWPFACEIGCGNCWLGWLKSPVEVDDGT